MESKNFMNRGKPGQDPNKKDGRRPPEDNSRVIFFVFLVLGFFMLVQVFSWPKEISRLSYSQFYEMVVNNLETNQIVEAELTENLLRGRFSDGKDFTIYIPQNDVQLIPLLSRNIPNFFIKAPNDFLRNVFYSVLPMVLFFVLLYFFFYRGASQGGGRLLSFGKSRAKQMGKDGNRMTFKDVAGVEEAKQELVEIIEFLKDPKKFQKLGGKIPKGVLLMGPPGTGKTLLAKAVAGEAEVPFFSISGSDFVEMFVGVGASRVRDLFEQAKKSAKTSGKGAIIFVDEIDAVGRQRFAGIGGGHDEREQTLNALLVEMDGFNTNEAVILIGATNRPDVLDPALMRPGRFDRQIVVDRPNLKGREEILNVHVRGVKLHKEIDLHRLARQTPGFSGADLASLVNEAALLAARKNKKSVTQDELEEAIEKVMAGPERRSHVISKKERIVVAGHESGHALVSLLVDHADPLHKVSIIPRGKAALGYTLNVPLEDRYLVTEEELVDRITVALSGRVAEELLFQQVTTGAANDFEVATALARRMVCEFGMSKNMGPLTFGRKQHEVFLGRDIMDEQNYSDETALMIDREVRRIMDSCYTRSKSLLMEHRAKLDALMQALLEREVLDGDEVCGITGITPQKRMADEEEKAEPKAAEALQENKGSEDDSDEDEQAEEDSDSEIKTA